MLGLQLLRQSGLYKRAIRTEVIEAIGIVNAEKVRVVDL